MDVRRRPSSAIPALRVLCLAAALLVLGAGPVAAGPRFCSLATVGDRSAKRRVSVHEIGNGCLAAPVVPVIHMIPGIMRNAFFLFTRTQATVRRNEHGLGGYDRVDANFPD